MSKRKGSNAERALVKKFWSKGWGCIRTAGSGSQHFPAPDILAGNKIRRLAVEVKATKANQKYFPKAEIKQLYNFADYFGAEPWIAIKYVRQPWVFVNPEDLDETGKNYVHRQNSSTDLSFQEVIGEF